MSNPTRATKFHFRPVKLAKTDVIQSMLALAEKGAINITEKKEGETLVAIQRDAVSLDLPVYTAADFEAVNPQFLADLLHAAVETTARKMFVDAGGPEVEITIADVIAANTATGRIAVSAETIASFGKWVTDSLAEQGQPAGTVSIIGALIKNKFNTATLTKFRDSADQIPAVLAILKQFSLAEGALPEYADAVSLFDTNLTNYTIALNTKSEVLDLSGLSI
jgi:hypothetical protein